MCGPLRLAHWSNGDKFGLVPCVISCWLSWCCAASKHCVYAFNVVSVGDKIHVDWKKETFGKLAVVLVVAHLLEVQ